MGINPAEIQEWVAAKMPDVVTDLKRICRIRSVADLKQKDCPDNTGILPYGQGCIDVLREMLSIGSENGFAIHNFDNYVGRISYSGAGREKKKSIGIWAHLDVVDEGDVKNWDYPPYEPTVKDNYLIARGCQDNKSSAIVGLYALKYMKEHAYQPRHAMELYLGTCEEQGMHDIDYFLEHYKAPDLSLVPDSGFPVCCGERGSFKGELICDAPCSGELLEIGCNCEAYMVPDRVELKIRYSDEALEKCGGFSGDVTAEPDVQGDTILITARGVSTQASVPAKGRSALDLMARLVRERELLGEEERKVFALVEDINRDHAGTALHIACEDELSGSIVCVATRVRLSEGHLLIDFTSNYPITKSGFPFEPNTQEAVGQRGFTLHTTRLSKANYFDPDRREVRILTRVSNEVWGRNDEPFVMSGGTYARKLPNAFAFGTGMPLPPAPEGLLRPGHGDYHQPDESICLERIQKGLEIYIRGLLEIDGD